MASELKIKTKILPGNKVEFSDPNLPVGQTVEVSVSLPDSQGVTHKSAYQFLKETPPPGVFKTADEVDSYLRQERDSWDR